MKILRMVTEPNILVHYLGAIVRIPAESQWIAAQNDGHLCVFYGDPGGSDKPEFINGIWYDAQYIEGRQSDWIAEVDLEGEPPEKTLKKASELEKVHAEDLAYDFKSVVFDINLDPRIPGLKEALRLFNEAEDPCMTGYAIEDLIEKMESKNGDLFTHDEQAAEVARLNEQMRALAAEGAKMRSLIDSITNLDNEPQYHDAGMGCGLEDRGITDRYEAMGHGWDCAMERIYGEVIPCADELDFTATDAILNEVRAQAVEGFADVLGEGDTTLSSLLKRCALDYAARIRSGEVPDA